MRCVCLLLTIYLICAISDVSQATLVQAFDTNSAAGTGSTGTYAFAGLTADGVLFDLAFDITAFGGSLNGGSDGMGVGDTSVDESEALTINNVTISGESGGSVSFDSILRVGFEAASAMSDSAEFTSVNGASPSPAITWTDLPTEEDLDGTNKSDSAFDLFAAFGAPVMSFTVASTGGSWKLDAVEMQFTGTAVPEPSPCLIFGALLLVPCLRFAQSRRESVRELSSLCGSASPRES